MDEQADLFINVLAFVEKVYNWERDIFIIFNDEANLNILIDILLSNSESAQINKFRTQTLSLPPMSAGVGQVIEFKPVTLLHAYSPWLIPGIP